MKIIITESQYKLLVENDDYNPTNKQLDKDNITIDNLSKKYPQWDFSNATIKRKKNLRNVDVRFLDGLFCPKHGVSDNINVADLDRRSSGCRQCGRDRQIELVTLERDVEFENKEIERIKDYVRNGGEFISDYYKDENYKWLVKKFRRANKEKFFNILGQISEIQGELGIKKEWWGEKTIKEILKQKGFNGVVSKHRYKECKNSISCRQYEFDVYLPYNEHNVNINKNIPETGIIFEYDGKQHFQFIPYFYKTEEKFDIQIFRDKEKNLFCKNYKPNPIKLVRIPYTSKTEEDIKQDINLALDDSSMFILTGDYPKAGWNK